MKNCYREAFGDFDPQGDEFAAIKIALSNLVGDGRFDDLENLLTDGHPVGAVEGCPGWILERRDSTTAGNVQGYVGWPDGKSYRAYVDPEELSLRYPEVYLEAEVFRDLAKRVVVACAGSNQT